MFYLLLHFISLAVFALKSVKRSALILLLALLSIDHFTYRIVLRRQNSANRLFNQYGGNIVKAHIGRWSEDCPEHQAVVVYSMDDTPLVSPLSAQKIRSRFSTILTLFRDSALQQDLLLKLADWSPRASLALGRRMSGNIFERYAYHFLLYFKLILCLTSDSRRIRCSLLNIRLCFFTTATVFWSESSALGAAEDLWC